MQTHLTLRIEWCIRVPEPQEHNRYRFWAAIEGLEGRILRVVTLMESREISEGVVLDYDKSGYVVGIDIDNASLKVNLHELMVSRMPLTTKNHCGLKKDSVYRFYIHCTSSGRIQHKVWRRKFHRLYRVNSFRQLY